MPPELDPDILWLKEKMELLKIEMEVFKCEFIEKFGAEGLKIIEEWGG